MSIDRRRPHLVLASRSPQRSRLLAQAGYDFEVIPPSDTAECGLCSGENPAEMVARLAYQKAADVARRVSAGIVLGCDTVAECDGQVLGKPVDEEHAQRMLETLQGRKHRVFSGVCLWSRPDGEIAVDVAITWLVMERLAADELAAYISGGGWEGKAGGFGYQDRLGWVRVIEGSESNVIGLPMELLATMLDRFESRPAAGG